MIEDRISFENNGEGGVRYDLPSSVSVEDLMRNKVGITIVLDNLNSQSKRIQRLTEEMEELKCMRISLPVSIGLAISSLIGTIQIAIGVNMLTSDSPSSFSYVFLAFGGILSICALVIPIIHPWNARRENRKRRT